MIRGIPGIRLPEMKIRSRLTVLIAALLVLSLGAIVLLSTTLQNSRAEQEMLEKARVLSEQMNAVWDFIELNQDLIDTDSDGSYNFKGIYCAIAGKSIAVRFSRNTDYIIKYTSTNPRKQSALPDGFEAEAFSSFTNGQSEFFGISEYDGEDVFRYVTPLYIEDSCLRCHGEPKGEIDLTGYPKEGLVIGDTGGAVSIIIPIKDYMTGIQNDTIKQVFFISAIVLVLMAVLYIAVSRLIMNPLMQLKDVAEDIEEGNLNAAPGKIHAVGELRELIRQFDSMTRKLQSSYENLESQVSVRTEQLKEANEVLKRQQDELEKANLKLQDESQYKSDFLAIMSHELRTPLTSIIAFTEMWESSTVNKGKDEYETIREIKENGHLLLQMISNILESARFEAGKEELSLEEIDIVDLYGAVQDSVGFIAEKRDISLKTEIDPGIPIFMGDWAKLRRILENLASNAIKFTSRGGKVIISAAYDPSRHNAIMRVSDNGIGIKKEHLPHIFDKFIQSDFSSYRRYSGSGLGLSVVKDLVSLLGGSIEVESVYHEGSIFTIRIPTTPVDRGEEG
jgi:signal transduction histidine kinase